MSTKITAPFHVGEMVRLKRSVMRVTGHTMTVSATCGCGYHHYDLETPRGSNIKMNVCGADLGLIKAKGKPPALKLAFKNGNYWVECDGVRMSGVTRHKWEAEHVLTGLLRETNSTRRPCISCGNSFPSEGAHHRMCNGCRGTKSVHDQDYRIEA